MRRASLVALVVLAGCSHSTPTAPPPPPALGTPQTLSFTASPVHLPAEGGPVRLQVAITVEPGAQLARVPVTVALEMEGREPIVSQVFVNADGRWSDSWYLTRTADVKVTAGALQQTIRVTRDDSTVPPFGPSCNGVPGYCPEPPKPPLPPLPPDQPTILADLTPDDATPITGTVVTFTSLTLALYGAAPVTSYRWNYGDGSPEEVTAVNRATHIYTTPGLRLARVTATNGVQSASASATITVTAPTPAPLH